MDEEQIHRDAFEIYFESRQTGKSKSKSINAVVLQKNCSERSVWDWKKNFNWDEKEAIRSAEINKKVQEKNDSTITDNKVQYLSYYHELLNNLKEEMENGEGIKIENVADLKRVIDGALILQGESIDRSEIRSSLVSEDEELIPDDPRLRAKGRDFIQKIISSKS